MGTAEQRRPETATKAAPGFFEGGPLRLSSPFGAPILGIGMRSRLARRGPRKQLWSSRVS
eukprot:4097701-Pyramimonas_sp.AAC.1